MIDKDEREEAERLYDLAEYIALFINPSAVSEIQKARKDPNAINNSKNTDGSVISTGLDNEDFAKFVASKFSSDEVKPEFKQVSVG